MERFAAEHSLDDMAFGMLRSAPQHIVESMLDAGLGPKVRKPSAYVVKAIKNKIAEAAAEAAEAEDPATDEKVTEGHIGAEDVGTWYEDEGGAEGYSRAENDRDDEDDGAWYRGGWHDDDYAEEEGWAEDEQSMSWQEDWQEDWAEDADEDSAWQ